LLTEAPGTKQTIRTELVLEVWYSTASNSSDETRRKQESWSMRADRIIFMWSSGR